MFIDLSPNIYIFEFRVHLLLNFNLLLYRQIEQNRTKQNITVVSNARFLFLLCEMTMTI